MCFEPLTVGNGASARHFACTHAVCAKCDTALFVRGDDRCPTCRAARLPGSKVNNRTREEMMQRCSRQDMNRATLQGFFPESVFFPVDMDGAIGAPLPPPLPLPPPPPALGPYPPSDTDDDGVDDGVDAETDAETQAALLMDARALMNSRATSAVAVARSASLPGPPLSDLRSDVSVAGAVHALVNAHAVSITEFTAAATRLRQARRSQSVLARRPTTRAHGSVDVAIG